MKILALTLLTGLGSTAALVHTGVLPCPLGLVARHITGAGCGTEHGCCGEQCVDDTAPAVNGALNGDYIDARDCTVFGGACHVNGEVESQGRSALVAWRLDSGGKVVAAVEGDSNLGPPNGGPVAQRRAVLYLDGVDDAVARRLAESAGLAVVARHAAAVSWERAGDRFEVRVTGLVELSGTALADRSCCTMPGLVWYRPLAGEAIQAPIVGNPDRCRFAGADGLRGWTYEGANTVFLGRFALSAAAGSDLSCAAPDRSAS